MTQTPRTPFNGYINIPEDEKFNPNRPTLDAICRGNRTMGNILNYFSHRAGLEADRQKLGKDCKVVTISIDREKVLQDLDISEKTYIMYMKRFRAFKYILSQRYSRHYEVSFEAINEAIAKPPAPTRLGRPPKTESCTHSSQESTSTFKEKGSTYVQELEKEVEVLSEKLKVLDERWKVLELSEKRLDENRKVLALSESRLATLEQAFRAVFGDPKNYKNLVELKEEGVSASASPPSPSFSSDTESHSHPVTADTTIPVTDDATSAFTGQADVIPIATGATEITAVTQVSQESEAVHAGSHSSARTSDSGVRPPADTTQPITDSVYPAPGGDLPDGTHRGLLHQGASGDTLGNDGNTGVHGYEKAPDEEDIPTVPRLGAIKIGDTHGLDHLPTGDHRYGISDQHDHTDTDQGDTGLSASHTQAISTQQTPLLQATEPVLAGDARESTVTPPGTSLLPSHPFYAELDIFAEDTWVVLAGLSTETVSGEVRVSGDTSQIDAASENTDDALWDSTTNPVSSNKTHSTRRNKKVPEGPPAFPAPDALWNAEAAVEIVEAKKGRRYGDTTRAQELTEAKKVLKMDFNGVPITRKQFEDAWDDMAGWAFWKEHTNVKPMIRTLRKDDKIIAILEELSQKKTKRDGKPTPTNSIRKPPPIDDLPYFTQDMYDNLHTRGAYA